MWGWNNMYHRNFFNMNHHQPSLGKSEKESARTHFDQMTIEEVDSALREMKILEGKILESLEVIAEKYVEENSNKDIRRSAKMGWNLYSRGAHF